MAQSAKRYGADYTENRTGYDINRDGRVGSRTTRQFHEDKVSYRRAGDNRAGSGSTGSGRDEYRRSRRSPERRTPERRRSRSGRRDSSRGRKGPPPPPPSGSIKQPVNTGSNNNNQNVAVMEPKLKRDYEVWPPPGMMWYVDEDPPSGNLTRRPPSPPPARELPRSGSRTVKITNLSDPSVPANWATHPSPQLPQTPQQQRFLPSPYRNQPVQQSPMYHTPPHVPQMGYQQYVPVQQPMQYGGYY